jgi:hypothetical protein
VQQALGHHEAVGVGGWITAQLRGRGQALGPRQRLRPLPLHVPQRLALDRERAVGAPGLERGHARGKLLQVVAAERVEHAPGLIVLAQPQVALG